MSKKAVIVYQSGKSGNTKGLVDEVLRRNPEIQAFHVSQARQNEDALAQAEVIVLASGIYFGRPDKKVTKFARTQVRGNQQVFVMLTQGSSGDNYRLKYTKRLEKLGVSVLGSVSCQGRNDLALFKLLGGAHDEAYFEEEFDRVISELEKALR